MKYGSVFSGIGGFEAGFDDAGLGECVWQVESDPAAARVLERHWPHARRYGDVTTVDPARLGAVDLVCGGPPCQDWSVAGKRAGISGSRGRLFHELIRIADAVAPRWLVMENVPGLLHAGKPAGDDFATVLESITGFRPAAPAGGWRSAGVCSGPKRHCCWRVLDARFFNVAQRRRRVFLVASTPDASCVEILFELEGGGGHPAPGREAGAGLAPAVTSGARRASGNRAGEHLTAFYPTAGTRDLSAGPLSPPPRVGSGVGAPAAPAVAHTLRAAGCDASEDGTGRGTPLVVQQNGSDVQVGTIPGALAASQARQTSGDLVFQATGAGAFRAGGVSLSAGDDNGSNQVVTAFNWQSGGSKDFVAPKEGHTDALGTSQTPAVACQCHGNPAGGGRRQENNVQAGMTVRRLTPTECLRLMGQPDSYLDLDPPLSDSIKYRLCGNSVVRTVAAWLGRRIAAALDGGLP